MDSTHGKKPEGKARKRRGGRGARADIRNLVGDRIPAAVEVSQTCDQLARIDDLVGKFGVRLLPEHRQKSPKSRLGIEGHVGLVVGLADARNIKVTGASTLDLRADLAVAQRVVPLLSATGTVWQHLADTVLTARGECWWAFLAYYEVLSNLSATDALLFDALRPVRALLAPDAEGVTDPDDAVKDGTDAATGAAAEATTKSKPKRVRSIERVALLNRVGHHVPTDAEIQAIIDLLEQVDQAIGKFGVRLMPAQRQHLPRFRPGAEALVGLIAELSEQRGVVVPGATIADMRNDFTLIERVAPLVVACDKVKAHLGDTHLAARSECWAAFATYYKVLAGLTRCDAELFQALAPVRSWMAGKGDHSATPI